MYRRRITIVLVFMFLVLAGLLARLGILQIVRGNECRVAIEKSGRKCTLLPARRGMILDRKGQILAMDEACFTFCLDYRLMIHDEKWLAAQGRKLARSQKIAKDKAQETVRQQADRAWDLAAEVCGSPQARDQAVADIVAKVQALERVRGERPSETVESHVLVGELDEKAANALRTRIDGQTIGASIRPANRRWYPHGQAACHVIGVTGPITSEQLATYNQQYDDAPWLEQMIHEYGFTDRIGTFGVEKMCEDALRGTRGYIRSDQRQGQGQSQVVSPEHGKNVRLSLDIELQKGLAEAFRNAYPGRNGSIVLLNVADSSVLAMVSVPSYDLNSYRKDYPQLATANWGPGINDGRYLSEMAPSFSGLGTFPLIDRGTARLYEPGSTVKPVLALAGLSEGVITPETTFTCEGRLFSNSAAKGFTCTHTHGPLNLAQAIQHSCNVYFYNVGIRLERKRHGAVVEWMHRFGLGDRTGLGLPGEYAGVIRQTHRLDEAMLAIGQGAIGVTPLQVANAIATIARNGQWLPATILMDDKPTVSRDLRLRPGDVRVVQEGMHMVTSDPGGTAYPKFSEAGLDFEVCAKSGTAQTPKQPWTYPNGTRSVIRQGHMAWLVGFAPYRNPQVAFAVIVEYVDYDSEGGGATIAGPLAIDALRMCSARGYIK